MTNEHWRRIRALRARPPAIAEVDEKRREVFQSSLTQAEELWAAASAVGPASLPLPLFYSLSQATRAICAAWLLGPEWEPGAHGLKDANAGGAHPLLMRVSVTKRRGEAFRMLAAAVKSPLLEGEATLSDLWASLPEFPPDRSVTGEARRWLLLRPSLAPVAHERRIEHLLAPRDGVFYIGRKELEDVLPDYPTTNGWIYAGVAEGVPGFAESVVWFPETDPSPDEHPFRLLSEVGDPMTSGARRRFAVRPRLGSGLGPPPSQLLTLWALLFGLSMIARYYPATWVRALDPDGSKLAVPLETGLDVALKRVPELILPALTGSDEKRRLMRARLATDAARAAGESNPKN